MTGEVRVSFHHSTRFRQHDICDLSNTRAGSAIWDPVLSSVFAQGNSLQTACAIHVTVTRTVLKGIWWQLSSSGLMYCDLVSRLGMITDSLEPCFRPLRQGASIGCGMIIMALSNERDLTVVIRLVSPGLSYNAFRYLNQKSIELRQACDLNLASRTQFGHSVYSRSCHNKALLRRGVEKMAMCHQDADTPWQFWHGDGLACMSTAGAQILMSYDHNATLIFAAGPMGIQFGNVPSFQSAPDCNAGELFRSSILDSKNCPGCLATRYYWGCAVLASDLSNLQKI